MSERQHCHNEDKKVCQLEERTKPKQVKKYEMASTPPSSAKKLAREFGPALKRRVQSQVAN